MKKSSTILSCYFADNRLALKLIDHRSFKPGTILQRCFFFLYISAFCQSILAIFGEKSEGKPFRTLLPRAGADPQILSYRSIKSELSPHSIRDRHWQHRHQFHWQHGWNGDCPDTETAVQAGGEPIQENPLLTARGGGTTHLVQKVEVLPLDPTTLETDLVPDWLKRPLPSPPVAEEEEDPNPLTAWTEQDSESSFTMGTLSSMVHTSTFKLFLL